MNTKELVYGRKIANKKYFVKRITMLGIKPKYIGFFYLIAIMDLLINKNYKLKCFYKTIYPIVAQKYNKSVCTVERNLRSLIEKSWNNTMSLRLNCFCENKNKPTCGKFIVALKSYLTEYLN